MTTQIVLATTAFGLVTATAVYESGMLERCERRILAVACTSAMPEATTPMRAIAGVPDLMSRFDAVYDYNACIEPCTRRRGGRDPEIFHCGNATSG